MKLFIPKDKFAKIIRMIYLGNRMINSHRTDDILTDYESAYRYMLWFCKDYDLSDLVSDIDGTIYPSLKLEMQDESDDYRQEYNEEIFRSELADRLAQQDVVKLVWWEDQFLSMDRDARFALLSNHTTKREEEFEEYGLERMGKLNKD